MVVLSDFFESLLNSSAPKHEVRVVDIGMKRNTQSPSAIRLEHGADRNVIDRNDIAADDRDGSPRTDSMNFRTPAGHAAQKRRADILQALWRDHLRPPAGAWAGLGQPRRKGSEAQRQLVAARERHRYLVYCEHAFRRQDLLAVEKDMTQRRQSLEAKDRITGLDVKKPAEIPCVAGVERLRIVPVELPRLFQSCGDGTGTSAAINCADKGMSWGVAQAPDSVRTRFHPSASRVSSAPTLANRPRILRLPASQALLERSHHGIPCIGCRIKRRAQRIVLLPGHCPGELELHRLCDFGNSTRVVNGGGKFAGRDPS